MDIVTKMLANSSCLWSCLQNMLKAHLQHMMKENRALLDRAAAAESQRHSTSKSLRSNAAAQHREIGISRLTQLTIRVVLAVQWQTFFKFKLLVHITV